MNKANTVPALMELVLWQPAQLGWPASLGFPPLRFVSSVPLLPILPKQMLPHLRCNCYIPSGMSPLLPGSCDLGGVFIKLLGSHIYLV